MVQCNVGTIIGICICLYFCVYVVYTEIANYIYSPLKALLPVAATRGSYNLRYYYNYCIQSTFCFSFPILAAETAITIGHFFSMLGVV